MTSGLIPAVPPCVAALMEGTLPPGHIIVASNSTELSGPRLELLPRGAPG